MSKNNSVIVSIIVCSFNEMDYIERCLISLLNQKNVPGCLDILVIDGMSTDGTREKIFELMKTNKMIRFYDNPDRIKPQAINIGFSESRGEYFVICDAHAVYDEFYISTCLELIKEHPDAWCVGGPFSNIGETSFGKALAIAMNSPIGVGNAKHRHPNYEGYGEMVMFGLFPRFVLDKVGYYDESFVINHDDEYCFRLRKAGGKVYISHRAKCYYFVRKSPSTLFRQYYSYGLWQIAFLKKHKIPISLRQLVPFGFFLLVSLLFLIGIITKNLWIAFSLPAVYLTVLLGVTVPVLVQSGFRTAINFPLAIFLLHFSYALGFFRGIFKFWDKKF